MTQTNRPLTVVALLLAMFMAAMEATVVATAMPSVVADLHGIDAYGLVGAVYMLASTVSMPLYGKLADLHGRKPVLLAGVAVFVVGSSASGLASSMTQLIVFRAVQGLGAGGMQPIAITIVGDLFRADERARIQGLFAAVWGVAGVIGPLVGGVIVRLLSWRWVFYINVPFGVMSALVLVRSFRERMDKKERRLDVLGALALAAAVVALLVGANRWAPGVTLPIAAIMLAAFIVIERRAAEPILPIDLLLRPLIRVSSIAGGLVGGVMMASVMYLPLYVQAVQGGTPTVAGAAVAPMLVGLPIASAASGRLLKRLGAGTLVRLGFAVVAAASALVTVLLRHGASGSALGGAMFVMGVGLGLSNTALVIAVQESVPWGERGVATASSLFFRTMGGTVAVGALGGVLSAGLRVGAPIELLNRLVGPDHGRGIDPAVLAPLVEDLQQGLLFVFAIILALSIAAFVTSLFFPDPTPTSAPGSSAAST